MNSSVRRDLFTSQPVVGMFPIGSTFAVCIIFTLALTIFIFSTSTLTNILHRIFMFPAKEQLSAPLALGSNSSRWKHNRDHLQAMSRLFREDSSMHGWEALSHEPSEKLCNRTFIYRASGVTCKPIGNGLQPALNTIVAAVIMNYTVVVDPMDCNGLLRWVNWIVLLQPLEKMLQTAGCPIQPAKANAVSRCALMSKIQLPKFAAFHSESNGGW